MLNNNSDFNGGVGDEVETVKNSMINLLNVVVEQDDNPNDNTSNQNNNNNNNPNLVSQSQGRA